MILNFIDTSYILALELARDQHHLNVKRSWRQLIAAGDIRLVTTTFVLDEIVTFFNSKGHHSKAVDVGNRLLTSPSVEMIQVDENLLRSGWDYFVHNHDKTYSLTDCISFCVMRDRNLVVALTTDQHFTQAGFTRYPEL